MRGHCADALTVAFPHFRSQYIKEGHRDIEQLLPYLTEVDILEQEQRAVVQVRAQARVHAHSSSRCCSLLSEFVFG